MKFTHLLLLGLALLLSANSAHAASGKSCTTFRSLLSVLRSAKSLDNKVECIQGTLRPLRIQNQSSILVLYKLAPPKTEGLFKESDTAGLIDWDEEFGVPESMYKPESYELISAAARTCPEVPEVDLTFHVEIKAIVEYKKGLAERASKAGPAIFSEDSARRAHHDTELILLEFYKVTAECRIR